MRHLSFTPPPTVDRFMCSDARMRVIMGPVGSGKSVGCCVELVRRAQQQAKGHDGKRHSRACVVRNTMKQLQDTTIKTFMDWFPEADFGVYRRGHDKSYMMKFADVELEILFRALDDEKDKANLLSLELTFAWFNECREISPVHVSAMDMRVGRYPSMRDGGPTWNGILCDTNPPTEGTWWYHQMEKIDPEDGLSFLENDWDVFKQPSGLSPEAENIENLRKGYYDSASGKTPDEIRTMIRGEYGRSVRGEPVFPLFSTNFHVAKKALSPMSGPDSPIVVGMDLGLTPAVVIGQTQPRGAVVILDEIVETNMGVLRFVRERLKPLLFERFATHPVIVVCDPAGKQRAQTDERTAVEIIEGEGLLVMPARTNAVAARISAVDAYLMRHIDGDSAFLIDPRCTRLKASLLGGYRYHKRREEIDKVGNPHTHVADALQYFMLHVGDVSGAPLVRYEELSDVDAAGWT